jgi:hypothetical protein
MQTRYQFDRYGNNPDNLIVDEEQTAVGNNGVIVPTYAPYYAGSLIVETATAVLVRGVDYYVGELSPHVTSITNLEASNTIILINPQTDPYTVTYQCVGGEYQNVSAAIASHSGHVYTGPIDWNQVVNEPDLFPPSAHPHVIDDVIGWGYLVESMERIRQAIIVSNVPAYEYLVDWVTRAIEDIPTATCGDILYGDPIKRPLSLGGYHLLSRVEAPQKTYTVNTVYYNRMTRKVHFTLTTGNVPDGVSLDHRATFTNYDTPISHLAYGKLTKVFTRVMRGWIEVPYAIPNEDWSFELTFINLFGRTLDLCGKKYKLSDLPRGPNSTWLRSEGCCTTELSPLSLYIHNGGT